MSRFRHDITRRLMGALALGMLCVLPATAQTAAKPTLLVFPFDRPENVDPTIADTIASAIRNRLQAMGRYEFMTYNTRSALVQRAIQSGSISRDDAEGPFEGNTGADIARTLGLDYALAGIVDDASMDVVANTATVTVSAQLVAARAGQVLQTAAASGSATETAIAADALMRRAADDAAAKLVAQLFGGTTPPTGITPIVTPGPTTPTVTNGTGTMPMPTDSIPVERKGKKKNNNLLLFGGIALLGIIIAGSGGGGGGGNGGGGGTNPPPIPL